MSAAAARRRKQLAARKATGEPDVVGKQLQALLESQTLEEAEAYEAMQLAQSVVRKRVHQGQAESACDLAYQSSLALLQKHQRVSVASQLLTLLADVLKETHTEETEVWVDRLTELASAHTAALDPWFEQALNAKPKPQLNQLAEILRLHRLQRDWLRQILQWSQVLGKIHFGHYRLHAAMATQCWKLTTLHQKLSDTGNDHVDDSVADETEMMDLRCDAVQHMALAEQPEQVIAFLKTLKKPDPGELAVNHTGPPAVRDALLTRTVLLLVAVENMRDALTVVKLYLEQVEERSVADMAASYTNKEDGKAPAHVMFCSMLLRVCQKEQRTGPLFSWLLRSFRYELDRLYKPQAIQGLTTKIGKIYFAIQPPPSMMSMMENMMSMMGGGGGGAGMMDPSVMQAALGAMQGGAR